MRPSPTLLLALLTAACGGNTTTMQVVHSGQTDAATEAPRRAASMGVNRAALSASDPINDGQAHYHVWRIELDPSQRVRSG